MDETTVVPGNAAKVEDWLLGVAVRLTEAAKKAAQADLWPRVVASDSLSRGRWARARSAHKKALRNLKEPIELPEAATQCDTLASMITDALRPQGTTFVLLPRGGATQKQADAMASLMQAEIDWCKSDPEIDQAASRYLRYPAGLKVVITQDTTWNLERVAVPLEQVAEELGSGAVPIGDQVQAYDEGRPIQLLRSAATTTMHVALRAIETRRIALSDMSRSVQNQISIHEFHYLTQSEIGELNGIRNLDRLGSPNASGKRTPDGAAEKAPVTEDAGDPFGSYELTESWFEPPWADALKKSIFTEADLEAFEAFYSIEIGAHTKLQKWQVLHKGSDVLLCAAPTYLSPRRARCFPYHMASGYPEDGTTFGDVVLDRIASMTDWMETLLSFLRTNIQRNLNQSKLVDKSSGLKQEDFDAFEEPDATRWVANQIDPKTAVYWHEVPDYTNITLEAFVVARDLCNMYGVSPEMMGMGKQRSATGATINNERSQMRINAMDRRFKDQILLPALEDMRDILFANTSADDLYRRLGIEGANAADIGWTDPLAFSDKFNIVAAGSSDLASRSQKANVLMGLMNIALQLVMMPAPPPRALKLLELVMRYSGLTANEIAEFLQVSGGGPSIEQQIQAMVADPELDAEVKQEDDHALALTILDGLAKTDPNLAAQPNIIRFGQRHQEFFAAQQMLMAMAAPPKSAPPGENEKAKPENNSPDAAARREGQNLSAADDGAETNAGLTGAASLPG